MELYNEHAALGWLIIIGAICLTILIGAAIEKFAHNRSRSNLRVQTKTVRVTDSTTSRLRRNYRR